MHLAESARRIVVVHATIAILEADDVVLLDGTLAPRRTVPFVGAPRPFDIALSPDGTRIASCFGSGVTREGRSFSGDERWGERSAIAWAPDVLWALREPAGEVVALDPETLSVRARTGLDWGDEARITLVPHPEGHVYAIGSEGENGSCVHALLLDGERIIDVPLAELDGVHALAVSPSGKLLAAQTPGADPRVVCGFVDETTLVVARDRTLEAVDVGAAPAGCAFPPAATRAELLARAPADATAAPGGENRGSRLLARLLDEGAIELVRKANRRELADHLDDLFASRRLTAPAIAAILEEHDAVAELFADDDALAAMLADLG